MLAILFAAAVGYLLGSIPFGYLLVRMFRGQDIRSTGSGNIGATNVARSSPGLGILTLLLDAAKGFAAVAFAMWLARQGSHHATILAASPEQIEAARDLARPFVEKAQLLASIAAFFAITGHSFPVWLGFKGGKGVATAVGAFGLLAPQAMLGALALFLLTVVSTRFVSLGSVVAAAAFPLFSWLIYRGVFAPIVILIMSAASLLVILRHHQNISRLLSGSEPRFSLRHA
jgi:acyl phosphate:glycerol-3-phosphate acyltransferase